MNVVGNVSEKRPHCLTVDLNDIILLQEELGEVARAVKDEGWVGGERQGSQSPQ